MNIGEALTDIEAKCAGEEQRANIEAKWDWEEPLADASMFLRQKVFVGKTFKEEPRAEVKS